MLCKFPLRTKEPTRVKTFYFLRSVFTAGVHVPQGGRGVGSGILEAGGWLASRSRPLEIHAFEPTGMRSSGLVVVAS